MNGVVVDTELGVEIFCDTTGTFSAEMDGSIYRDKSITKVRKSIKAAKRTVKVLIYKGSRYVSTPFEVKRIAEVKARGSSTEALTVNADHYSGHYDLNRETVFLYDEEVAKKVRDLWKKADAEKEEIEKRRDGEVKLFLDTLIPLTAESFADALAQEITNGEA
jgi:hypothetical protein